MPVPVAVAVPRPHLALRSLVLGRRSSPLGLVFLCCSACESSPPLVYATPRCSPTDATPPAHPAHLISQEQEQKEAEERRLAREKRRSKRSSTSFPYSLFSLCALVPCVQGSSGAVATVQFVWRGHAKTPTTRAGPWPDFALRLE